MNNAREPGEDGQEGGGDPIDKVYLELKSKAGEDEKKGKGKAKETKGGKNAAKNKNKEKEESGKLIPDFTDDDESSSQVPTAPSKSQNENKKQAPATTK